MSALLECGHAANATDEWGNAVCAICVGTHPGAVVESAKVVELAGRVAKCSCGKTEPSSVKLPFFEFRGEGSRLAVDRCKRCGYSLVAHTATPSRYQHNVVSEGRCPGFEQTGAWETDSFYCGCRGWD